MFLCFVQAEDGIRDLVRSRGLGDVYKRQGYIRLQDFSETTDRELGAALTKLRGEGLQRLVLDLSLIHI